MKVKKNPLKKKLHAYLYICIYTEMFNFCVHYLSSMLIWNKKILSQELTSFCYELCIIN